jgi:acetylornithine deacetylase ArgE
METNLAHLLSELIEIPSVNPAFGGTGEAQLGAWVEHRLRRTRADVWTQEVAPGRRNIFAALHPRAQPALLLDAHLDTVAVAGNWTTDPFRALELEGRIYGRGACDTKGSLAVFLSVFEGLARAATRVARPLVFVASVDEEAEQRGAFAAVEGLALSGAIVGEPTQCRVIHAHKGFVRFSLRAKGRAAHSAFPERGDNAIFRMASALRRLEAHAADLARRPPHSALGVPSLNVGTISGGIGVNVVPDRCLVTVDRRTLPGETAATVQREIESVIGDEAIDIVDVVERRAVFTPTDDPLVCSMLRALEQCGVPALPEGAPYLTNATAYASAGVPSIVFGPGCFDQAHVPDEYIAVAELTRAADVLRCLLGGHVSP